TGFWKPATMQEWRFGVGVRIASVFFDSEAAGDSLQQHTSNNFIGAGPHASLELRQHLDIIPGLSVFTSLDGAVIIGQISQSFGESMLLPDGTLVGGATRIEHTQTVPTLTFQLGLTWTPPGPCANWLRFSLGYQYERWWSLGDAASS